MKNWLEELYQDDIAEDIKRNYLELLRSGKTNDEAIEVLLRWYHEFIIYDEDGELFWYVLADTQWRYGRLDLKVKEKALRHIESNTILNQWHENPNWPKVLQELKKEITSPMSEEKKIDGVSKIKR